MHINPDFIESEFLYKNFQEHHIAFNSYSIATGEKNEYIDDDVIDELYKLEAGKKYLFRSSIEREFREGSFARKYHTEGTGQIYERIR